MIIFLSMLLYIKLSYFFYYTKFYLIFVLLYHRYVYILKNCKDHFITFAQ